MLSSISPLGERARGSRWWLTTAAYVLGSLGGGLVLGLLAASVGALVPAAVRGSAIVLGAAAVLVLVGLAFDLGLRGGAVPSWRRQVDVAWLDAYRGWVMGVGFGAQLGFGLVTIITSATTYAVVLLAALGGDAVVGLLVGGTFGLVRALPSLLMARVTDRDALHRAFLRVEHGAKPARLAARVTLVSTAAALAFAAAGS
jgi:hypothetical protein